MSNSEHANWDPDGESNAINPLKESDAMRRQCPVASGGSGKWYFFRHKEIANVLLDHETFSNVVSSHVSVPNGMDPPEHTAYRKLVEPLFTRKYLAPFEASCRAIAAELIDGVTAGETTEVMETLAYPFAGRTQCAFLEWPDELAALLADWTQRNQAATRAEDRSTLTALAAEFEAVVVDVLRAFRKNGTRPNGVMSALLEARVNGRPLDDAELTSLLRNWTVGEIGTISASIGILFHALATHPDLQSALRSQPGKLPMAIDEILRVHGPLVSNRRRATRDTTIGGCPIHSGDEVNMMWVAANRDEEVFDRPGEILPERDPRHNLLYGAGIHVCPGAPLARLEMRVFLEECFKQGTSIELDSGMPPVFARHPAGGYQRLQLRFR